jgi:uncharacterized protein (TIGR00251 family)
MLDLEQNAGGLILSVLAHPGARHSAITGIHNGALKVSVPHPPDKGKANAAIVEVLSKALSVKRSQIELVSGATSRQKRFFITALDAAELTRRLSAGLR